VDCHDIVKPETLHWSQQKRLSSRHLVLISASVTHWMLPSFMLKSVNTADVQPSCGGISDLRMPNTTPCQ
jgi:hypothetical protein